MKIEKLTENKIRVILPLEELEMNHLNLHSIMAKGLESRRDFFRYFKKGRKGN